MLPAAPCTGIVIADAHCLRIPMSMIREANSIRVQTWIGLWRGAPARECAGQRQNHLEVVMPSTAKYLFATCHLTSFISYEVHARSI